MENTDLKTHLKNLENKLTITYAVALVVLVTLSLFSNLILKNQAATQAASLIKRTTERGDYREVVYTLNDAKLDYFNAVVFHGEDRDFQFSLPAQLDPDFIKDPTLFSKILYTRLPIDLFFGTAGDHKIATVLFIFNRFSHVPFAVLIWLFFVLSTMPVVRNSRRRVTENYNKQLFLHAESTRADLARRVRHDIRSPLGSLQIATHNLSEINSKQGRIIRQATDRITEIVSELELIRVSQKEAVSETTMELPSAQSILSLAQDIIQEKRIQLAYRSNVHLVPDFSQDAFFLFSTIKASDFKRTLSNLIDNAIEACHGKGRVTLKLARDQDSVLIEIADSGHGIAKEDLVRVIEKGFTTKSKGSGLGLYYSEKTVKDAGGTLSIRSDSDGTSVLIRLPSSSPPAWYVPNIRVPLNGNVVILDDQESIHLSWKMRLEALKTSEINFDIVCLKSGKELSDWYHKNESEAWRSLFLLDYDLGTGERNGLDIARELNLTTNAILVTGHFDSVEIQKRCEEQGLGLLPKSYLSLIEVKAYPAEQSIIA